MARTGDLQGFLLGLIGPNADAEMAATLGEEDWRAVAQMAAQHRIEPFLHARAERGELQVDLPAPIRELWRSAYRTSGIRALAKRKVLLDAHDLLTTHGIRMVALKGAWAAWHAYPAPAERPMRDIDLLVGGEHALEAFALLLDNGFRQEEAAARTPEQSLAHDKHLAPLLAPNGIRLELHMRLWERSEAIGWSMPGDESAAMLARAKTIGDDPVLYLDAGDRMVHAVIHGAYSNRLNGGPLTLLDIAAMVRLGEVDWPAFWHRAEQGGWARGASLLLHLADHWCGGASVTKSACPHSVDAGVLASAPALLLQDLEARKAVGMVAGVTSKMRDAGVAGAVGAAIGRLRGQDRAVVPADTAHAPSESFGKWVARRTGETAAALASPTVREAARGTARLGDWLDGKGR